MDDIDSELEKLIEYKVWASDKEYIQSIVDELARFGVSLENEGDEVASDDTDKNVQ